MEAQVKPINVAVWGLGRHAMRTVLPSLTNSSHAQLAGVYTRNSHRAKLASEAHKCTAWQDEEAMLNDPRVDAVYLATPIGLHYSQGMRVLSSAKHLICEKSLTHCNETSLELIGHARSRGLVLCETFMYLYHPQFLCLSSILCNANFGQMIALTSNFFLPQLEHPGFRYQPDLGGGAYLDAGCYPISMALALSPGDMPSVKYSQFSTASGYDVDTSGSALLKYENGAHAYLNWGYGFAYKNELSILGDHQSIYLNYAFSKRPDQCSSILLYDRVGKEQKVEIEAADSFARMFSHVNKATWDAQTREALLLQADRQSRLMNLVRECSPRPMA